MMRGAAMRLARRPQTVNGNVGEEFVRCARRLAAVEANGKCARPGCPTRLGGTCLSSWGQCRNTISKT